MVDYVENQMINTYVLFNKKSYLQMTGSKKGSYCISIFNHTIIAYLMKLIPETYLMKLIPETYLMKLIPETHRTH